MGCAPVRACPLPCGPSPHHAPATCTRCARSLLPRRHALQVTGGVLLPTLVLWLWEDRLRTRHLQLLIGQQSQQQGRQQRETGHSQVAPGVKPMPTTVALGWFAGTAWLLWLLLEALVL